VAEAELQRLRRENDDLRRELQKAQYRVAHLVRNMQAMLDGGAAPPPTPGSAGH
jgi:hypothetical protein